MKEHEIYSAAGSPHGLSVAEVDRIAKSKDPVDRDTFEFLRDEMTLRERAEQAWGLRKETPPVEKSYEGEPYDPDAHGDEPLFDWLSKLKPVQWATCLTKAIPVAAIVTIAVIAAILASHYGAHIMGLAR